MAKVHVSKALNGDKSIPLAVDFDGTMQLSDLNWEGLVWLLKHRPWAALQLVGIMLFSGRAAMKLRLEEWAEAWGWQPVLPWEEAVLERVLAARAAGREVVVVTGSPQRLVERLLREKGLDYEVVGTVDKGVNLVASRKAAALVERWGEKGFDYVGNSKDDLHVWQRGRKAWVRGGNARFLQGVESICEVEWAHPHTMPVARALWRAMRPHQWLKNLLVAMPLVAAHQWGSAFAWTQTGLAFAAFCLTASGAYLLNDLLDLYDDRIHLTKRLRPLAAGTLPLPLGLVASGGLVLAGFGIGVAGGLELAAVVAGYFSLTMLYSLVLKRIPIADVAILAALYGVRMLGGAAATGIPLSHWLVLMAFLLFYSLAMVKRYVELSELPKRHPGKKGARGYLLDDAPLLAMQGVGSGLMAVLVVALYTNSPDVRLLYAHPAWLTLLCPLMLWWLGRLWLLAHRGLVHDDPVVFAAKDRLTWIVGLVALVVVVVGR